MTPPPSAAQSSPGTTPGSPASPAGGGVGGHAPGVAAGLPLSGPGLPSSGHGATAGTGPAAEVASAGPGVAAAPLLVVEDLHVTFARSPGILDRLTGRPGRSVAAVRGVTFSIARGQTLALVGESGSGKTTTARAILRLVEATSGRITFDGIDVLAAAPAQLRRLRERIQIVFQDPYSSLNPRMTVADTIGEVLTVHRIGSTGRERRDRVATLLSDVGLGAEHAGRYPHELSGGQRQRVGIARALAVDPELLVLDEPVSALDVSVQAQIINLLEDLQEEHGLAYLFVAHDLAVVHHAADRISVMYLGEIVEEGACDQIFGEPHHPYTRALLASIPGEDPAWAARLRTERAGGEVKLEAAEGPGCSFRDRCPHRYEPCDRTPPFVPLGPGRASRCWLD
jgi:oligopeptide transport system ATP-binding protein